MLRADTPCFQAWSGTAASAKEAIKVGSVGPGNKMHIHQYRQFLEAFRLSKLGQMKI